MDTLKPAFAFSTVIIFCTVIFRPISVQGSPEDKAALFVFGDSMFDPGTNWYIGGGNRNRSAAPTAPYVWPYGKNFFNYPTGRYSDGRIIPDFIAEYMKLPLLPPYLQNPSREFVDGSNFASGGAGALVETRPGIVVNLRTQLSQFKNVEKKMSAKIGDLETKKRLSRAIFLFHVGSNDYFVRLENSTVLRSYPREEYVPMVIGNLTGVIKEIYRRGGRKFGIMNVAPLWLAPTARAVFSDAMKEELSELVKLHNQALPEALKNLQRDLKSFQFSEFDFYTSLSEKIKSPSKYGFKVAKEACCGSGPYRGISRSCGSEGFKLCCNADDYMFFDGLHPTDHASKEFAEELWSGSSVIAKPVNLKMFFSE